MRDLFEDLKDRVGCDYISDLRLGTNLSYAVIRANRLKVDDYNLHQWDDLAEYLFSERKNFASFEDVRAYFACKCTNPK